MRKTQVEDNDDEDKKKTKKATTKMNVDDGNNNDERWQRQGRRRIKMAQTRTMNNVDEYGDEDEHQ